MRWRAIFFDLDGTLIDTAPEIAAAVNDTLRHFGWSVVSQSQVDNWIGQGTSELLLLALAYIRNQTVAQLRHSEEFARVQPIFNEHYQKRCGTQSELFPHVRSTLKTLRDQGCHLALVTNKEGRYTQTILEQHDLLGYFDCIVSGDSFAQKKPDPVGVWHSLAMWQIAPAEALFVGDSSIDAETARRAGMPVWLLTYGYNMGQPLAASQPDRIIQSLAELL